MQPILKASSHCWRQGVYKGDSRSKQAVLLSLLSKGSSPNPSIYLVFVCHNHYIEEAFYRLLQHTAGCCMQYGWKQSRRANNSALTTPAENVPLQRERLALIACCQIHHFPRFIRSFVHCSTTRTSLWVLQYTNLYSPFGKLMQIFCLMIIPN